MMLGGTGCSEKNHWTIDPFDREVVSKIDSILALRERKGEPRTVRESRLELEERAKNLAREIEGLEKERMAERDPHFQRRLEGTIHAANLERTQVRRKLGLDATKVNWLKWATLAQRLQLAAEMALESDDLPEDVKEALGELVNLKTALAAVTILGAYALLHGMPVAAFTLDAALVTLGGADLIFAIFRIYTALEEATDEEGLKAASKVLSKELSGEFAKGILFVIGVGARKGGKEFGKRYELNPDALPGGGSTVGSAFGNRPFRKRRKPGGEEKPPAESSSSASQEPTAPRSATPEPSPATDPKAGRNVGGKPAPSAPAGANEAPAFIGGAKTPGQAFRNLQNEIATKMKGASQADKVKAFEDGVSAIRQHVGEFTVDDKFLASGIAGGPLDYTIFVGGPGPRGTPVLVIGKDGKVYSGSLQRSIGTTPSGQRAFNPHRANLLGE